jgi:phosphate:Na+ symporter
MLTDLMLLLGGLGLFLLGMVIMTDGLRGVAGDYLHQMLARFTSSPATGAATGAVSTAILQSSSATTVAAVGFVGAGLLTFPQALGVVFGANVGTTITGWLVALLGLKLNIGDFMLPLILVGVLIQLFGKRRTRHAGIALAGFALIFVGISTLQQGMAAYQGWVTPEDFPSDTLWGRLQLVTIGIAITMVTQSSSAGVATALTAVYTGTISFPQAAALVIGMDVGTTITAALATVGGSAATRRTGYSHVVYNLLTAIGALLLLSPYVWTWQQIAPGAIDGHAELALVGFHSLFNLLGVLLILPIANHFADLMHRLVAEPRDPIVDRLDRQLLGNPVAALDVVGQVFSTLSDTALELLERLLQGDQLSRAEVSRLGKQLDQVHAYVDRIHLEPDRAVAWRRLMAAIHMLDHLQRLHERCEEEPERAGQLAIQTALMSEADVTLETLDLVRSAIASRHMKPASEAALRRADELAMRSYALREQIMADVARGILDVRTGTKRLEGIRWLRRVTRHVARMCSYAEALFKPD